MMKKGKIIGLLLMAIILSCIIVYIVIAIPKYDPEILDAFENQTWVRVIVELKDNSNITITGTKEEKRELLRQRDEWFKPVIDNVLSTLSEDEFRIIGGKTSVGFDGYITKKGFDILIKDERVSAIYLDIIVHAAGSNDIILSENISTIEKGRENKTIENISLHENISQIEKEPRPKVIKEEKSWFQKFIQFIKSLFGFK